MVIESPSFGIPTPTNGAPPLVPVPWLAIPAAEPNVLFEFEPGVPVPDELSDEPSVAGPFVPVLDELPPSVGMAEPPRPPAPGDEFPYAEPDCAGDDDPSDE